MAVRPKTILPSCDGELGLAVVDVGRQHLDAQPAGVVDVLDHDVALVAVLDLAGQQRGHELGGVVGLQVGRLVAEHGRKRRCGSC